MSAPLRIARPDGEQLLAGLVWLRRPKVVAPVVVSPKLELTCFCRRARVHPKHAAEGNGSLLVALGQGLAHGSDPLAPDGAGHWVFMADLSTPKVTRYWFAAADISHGQGGIEVRPRYGAEQFFATQQDLSAALLEVTQARSCAGIVVADLSSNCSDKAAIGFAQALEKAVADRADPNAVFEVRIARPASGGTQRFRRQRVLTPNLPGHGEGAG